MHSFYQQAYMEFVTLIAALQWVPANQWASVLYTFLFYFILFFLHQMVLQSCFSEGHMFITWFYIMQLNTVHAISWKVFVTQFLQW